ncbi:hypothetical protein LSTR_LSTR011061 [Laodelphax striatellus]|uniref:Uncharacterized protein n=1 Tax=Laodelphax striatellus TaxID=195883 RepID=A0A482WGJ3_LAOST|nr:hypothetical protein LSTR_LSTR011061 [Laodelphax striatellus]
MIGFLFSYLILSVAVINSLPYEGYGILLVDLYDPTLSLPVTNDQENELEVIVTKSEQNDLNSKEITTDISDQELESLGEIVDLLSVISGGYKSPMIGIEMQLYKVDKGYRQNLVSVNMIVDPSDEEDEEAYFEENEFEKSDSDNSLEEYFVDVHHTYSPYDRLMNSYYGANTANFLPMNMYRTFLVQQQNQQPRMHDAEKLAADYYWNMMFNQENLENPADYWNRMSNQENQEIPTYQNYPIPDQHLLNTYNQLSYPTLEDALRMYDKEMETLRSQELYDDEEESSKDSQLVVDEGNRGIFSSFGNFFRKIWRVLID